MSHEPTIDELREQWARRAAKAEAEQWAVGKSAAELRDHADKLLVRVLSQDTDSLTLLYRRVTIEEINRLAKECGQ